MTIQQFRLPDVGEGLTEAEVVSWKVAPGDVVQVNDVLVEIETAKSLVELPSPYAGTVSELLVDEGRTVDVGTPIIAVEVGARSGAEGPEPTVVASPPAAGASVAAAATAGAAATPAPGAPPSPNGRAAEGRTAVLVGYGPRTVEAKRRPRRQPGSPTDSVAETFGAAPASTPVVATSDMATAGDAPDPVTTALGPKSSANGSVPESGQATLAARNGSTTRVLAKPPVRKLAKSLGVDLAALTPTGAGGVVTRADVESAARRPSVPTPTASPTSATAPTRTRGGETRVPIRGVRKATAQAMVASAFTAPHVTEWVSVDVTRLVELLERMSSRREFADVRLTPLVLVMRALVLAARRYPDVNASWDEAAQEIVLHSDVNLGIAAATPRGLVVPNIKAADRLTTVELAQSLTALVATAREGRTQPADMQGGTITITNVGVFGVDGGTPILNPGEAAILCFGAIRDMPWVVDGAVVPRKVTQLALSFDHRLIDGELGSRFLAEVAALLADPELMALRS